MLAAADSIFFLIEDWSWVLGLGCDSLGEPRWWAAWPFIAVSWRGT